MERSALVDEVLARGRGFDEEGAAPAAGPAERAYVEAVLAVFRDGDGGLGRTEALGLEWHASGGGLGDLVRETARLGRALEDALEARTGLKPDDRHRLRRLADEAAARAIESYALSTRGRHERWLSYYAHEMRNALNTLVNAHWILRNGQGRDLTKIHDMAERAVRRLESVVKEFRELESHVAKPAPGRPDLI
jgi:hypothetical protein